MSGREHGHDLAPRPSAGALAAPRSDDELEVVPGFERENLQGWIPQLATEDDIRAVIEKAFDYRGDVTITLKSNRGQNDREGQGSEITGYLFDRRLGSTLATSVVRLMVAASRERPTVPYSEIAAIAFSGRDTAAGKSYEAWVKKYWEKRAAGEKNISIEPEALE
ncbi:MAG: hypothetical protein ABSD75_09740 [Terriglobales bacterium]|jgi:hypothetical protein